MVLGSGPRFWSLVSGPWSLSLISGSCLWAVVGFGGAEPNAFWFRAVFECFVTDADGHHKVAMCKGASGTKVCAKCCNVVGRCQPADIKPGSSLVHFTCADPGKIQRLSPAMLREMMDHLQEAKPRLGKTAFKKLQQEIGGLEVAFLGLFSLL